MGAAETLKVTPEEYLTMERNAETRHEYVNGEVFAMAGASVNHNLIVMNFGVHLYQQLEGTPCRACTQDLRVRVFNPKKRAGENYVYPDVLVVCGEPELTDEHKDILLNPVLIAEILSNSTGDYDRGDKFAMYRAIPSLRHYILVSQTQMVVEHFVRQDNGTWILHPLDETGTLFLADLDVQIPVPKLYDHVHFELE